MLPKILPRAKSGSPTTEAEVMQTVNSGSEVTVEKRMIPKKVWLMPVRAAI